MVEVPTEVKIEQVRRVIQGMGWQVQKIEILEGEIIQLVIINRPGALTTRMGEGFFPEPV